MTESISYIKEGYNSIQKGNYSHAVMVLERLNAAGMREPYVLLLLALAYLYDNRFERADRIMQQLQLVEPGYPPLVQLRVFLKMKYATGSESAQEMYLDEIEKNPGIEGLQKARRAVADATDFSGFQKKALIADFVDLPKPHKDLLKKEEEFHRRQLVRKYDSQINPRGQSKMQKRGQSKKPNKKLLIILALFLVVLSTGVAWFYWRLIHTKGAQETTGTSIVDRVTIAGKDFDLIQKHTSKKPRHFYYNADAMRADFNRSRKLIKEGKHNKALYLLNRLHNSNISYAVREKVDFLIRFVIDVEDRNYMKVPYSEITGKSYLYRGYALKLKGKVGNLRDRRTAQAFTLLINYQKKDVFSGIVEVYTSHKEKIENGDLVEVRGIFVSTIGKKKRWYIVARRIAKIRKKD